MGGACRKVALPCGQRTTSETGFISSSSVSSRRAAASDLNVVKEAEVTEVTGSDVMTSAC